MYFIDESGSIPTFKSKKWKNRYFVIAFVHTNNPQQVKKVHKRSLLNVKKYYPSYFQSDGELKASDAPPFIKEYLLRRLIEKTDIKLGYMVVDTWNISDNFRQDTSRTFNYLIKLVLSSHRFGEADKIHLQLKLDNRNSAVKSLNSLEDYLHQELILSSPKTNRVSVEYIESANNYNIQAADLLANTIFQYYRFRYIDFPRHNQITKYIDVPCPEVHSYLYNQLIRRKLFFHQEFPGSRSRTPVLLT